MKTRIILPALLAALVGCDESANKPKSATGQPTRPPTSAVGPRAPAPAQIAGARPDPSAAPTAAPTAAAPAPKAEPPPPDAPKDGVLKHTETDSGLIIDDLKFGDGAEAKAMGSVLVHYRGTFPDGKEFDSTYKSGSPMHFTLGTGVIKAWQEGIPGMKVGGKRRLIVPPDLAYGKDGWKDKKGNVIIPPNTMLIFEIELVGTR